MKSFAPVQVKRSSAGLGLFAAAPISRGEQIIQYIGEYISEAEANRRGGKYLFAISDTEVIDGKGRENTARYINHSCDPNAEAVLYDEHEVIIEAIKDIAPGEEITYDYGEEYVADHIAPIGCKCAACMKK